MVQQKAMNGPLRHTVIITGVRGFHMRPMSDFAQLAARFKSKVTLSCEGRISNGKSILEMMGLIAQQGSEVTVEVDGPDAPAALDALVGLLQNLKRYSDEDDLPGPTPPGLPGP